MADITTTPTPTLQPVTSQDVTPPASSQDALEITQNDDTYKALSELFTQKEQASAPTTVPTPTPVGTEPAPAAAPQVDDFEKTLEGIKLSPNAHPNQIKATDELRRISREEHKRAEELNAKVKDYETKLSELETKLKSPTVPEDVQKELEDLRNMRKELDLKMDPDFQKNFIKPVQDSEVNIMRILTEAGLNEDTAKWIQEHGGVVNMSRSNEIVDKKNNLTAQQWVEDVLLAKTPTFHRNRALGELTNALNIQDKASRELQDFQGSAKERWEAKMQKLTQEFNAGRDEAISALGDSAKPKTASATDSAEVKAAIEAHNSRLQKAQSKFEEYMKTSNNPRVAGALIVKAVQADILLEANKELQSRVDSLQASIDKIKAAGNLSAAGDHTAPPPQITTPSQKDLLRTSDSKALSGLLDQAGVAR